MTPSPPYPKSQRRANILPPRLPHLPRFSLTNRTRRFPQPQRFINLILNPRFLPLDTSLSRNPAARATERRVGELGEAGENVACGADNQDGYGA